MVGLVGLVAIGAGALGAESVLDRFKTSSIGDDIRFQLWRQGFRVLAAHPLGIGRGAFERVFPVYRTLKTSFPLRFSFLENEPLQLFVDSGWPLTVGIAIAAGVSGWAILRHRRHDRVEAALLAGLAAVLAHSLVDFGFETLGVAVPWMAMLGATAGRLPTGDSTTPDSTTPDSPSPRPWRLGWLAGGMALGGLLFGVAASAHASSADMDAQLRNARTLEDRRQVLVRAQQTHPLDYFYALSFAQTEPLKGAAGKPSPRLHALNRALRLCPGCETVHAEVATNLWRLGLRPQSLLEWRTAVELQPTLLRPVLGRLFAAGAKPAELAALAASDPVRMIDIAEFLSSMARIADAITVLDQADALGAPRAASLPVRGNLLMQTGEMGRVKETIAAARSLGMQDPRIEILEARFLLASQDPKALEHALDILDRASARYPGDLGVARERVAVVLRSERWQAAARAIDGLKRALHEAHLPLTEAHAIDARVNARFGRWNAALGEFRIALSEESGNVALWMEMGEVAERAGRTATAADAYREASRLSPDNPQAKVALRRIEERRPSSGPSPHDER